MNTAILSAKSFKLAHRLGQIDAVDRRIVNVRKLLGQAQLVEALGAVALEHNLSEPVVATMRAIPGFADAVRNFPETSLFNIVPEHKSSVKQKLGLEALSDGMDETISSTKEAMDSVVSGVDDVFNSLGETAADFKAKLDEAKERLEAADVDEDVLANLSVFTLSEDRFGRLFGMLEDYLTDFSVFDIDDLVANPEKLKEEIDGLNDVVGDLGEALGLTLTSEGLSDADKSEEYLPSEDTLKAKGITKSVLAFYLERASGLCDELEKIAERKDDYINSLKNGAESIPEDLNSDDVTYGANEHITLFTCYVKLATKLVRESIVLMAHLLSATDEVLEVSAEAEANEAAPEEVVVAEAV